jgi:hypothetical protein
MSSGSMGISYRSRLHALQRVVGRRPPSYRCLNAWPRPRSSQPGSTAGAGAFAITFRTVEMIKRVCDLRQRAEGSAAAEGSE